MKKGKIHIGTSGWFYGHWDKVFYPENMPKEGLLSFYAQTFDTVEVNTTFYHLPSEQAVKNWYKRVGKSFYFSVKLSRYITHTKKLLSEKESLDIFFERIKPLKSKLNCILIQLPPSFRFNYDRLKAFLTSLPKRKRYSIEFRNESWFNTETFELLKKFKISLCLSDISPYPLAETITADFIYIRLHGSKRAYRGEYGIRGLKPWAKKIKNWSDKGLDVYCYFDNDEKGYAVADAKRMQSLLG